jgi:hypothetical protein
MRAIREASRWAVRRITRELLAVLLGTETVDGFLRELAALAARTRGDGLKGRRRARRPFRSPFTRWPLAVFAPTAGEADQVPDSAAGRSG